MLGNCYKCLFCLIFSMLHCLQKMLSPLFSPEGEGGGGGSGASSIGTIRFSLAIRLYFNT